MNTLIVSAAPSAHALTAELTVVAARTLRAQNHDVTIIDLNALKWDPTVRPSDYGDSAFSRPVGDHARLARSQSTLTHAVSHQQRLVADSELIIFVFPLWWAGMPAILKGWVDRVFTEGFAYGLRDAEGNPRKYGDGAFVGKRGLLITTAGDRESAFTGRGVNGGLTQLLFPINHGIFWYTGIAPLEPLTMSGVDTPTWPGIDSARENVQRRLATLDSECPIPYRRLLDDYDENRQLLAHHMPDRSDFSVHVAPEPAASS